MEIELNAEECVDYWVTSLLGSVVFLGMFFLATFLFVPKAVKWWRLWHKTGKTIHLSNAIAVGAGAIFFLAGDMLMFLQAVGGYAIRH